MLIDRRHIAHFDYLLLALTIAVTLLGLVILYSAGYDPEGKVISFSWLPFKIESFAFAKQGIFLLVGLVTAAIIIAIPSQFFFKYAYFFYSCCVVMLIIVDLIGFVAKGSQRWLDFGFVSLQPSEPTKLAVILALARYFSRNFPKSGGMSFKEAIVPVLIFTIPGALIMSQPDLGTALMVMGIGAGMTLFCGVRPKVIVAIVLLGVMSLYPAWMSLHDYQKRRVMVLINPDADPRGSGYHIIQSKIAVGSGALFGKGFLQGTQSQLEFLPEHTTDFIFSVLGEEWGFAGCIFLIGLYLCFLARIFWLVGVSKDLFPSLVILGVGLYFFFQSVVNIGMVIGLLPVVGLPLPLISYGGSSMLSCMVSLGIVLGMNMRRLTYFQSN
jgi:rod shape determining protein RodA